MGVEELLESDEGIYKGRGGEKAKVRRKGSCSCR